MCTNVGGATGRAESNGTFLPSKSDETASRISNAYNIKISKSTITLKDQDGKTRGMIRGVSRFTDMPARDQVEVSATIKRAGGLGEGVKKSDVFKYDGKLYVLNNAYVQRMNTITGENKGKNDVLKRLEKAGFIVANYDKR